MKLGRKNIFNGQIQEETDNYYNVFTKVSWHDIFIDVNLFTNEYVEGKNSGEKKFSNSKKQLHYKGMCKYSSLDMFKCEYKC